MLKKFHGAHLMEALHRKKLRDLLSKELLASRLVKIAISCLAMIILWAMPVTAFGVDGLTFVQQRVIAIFVFAILMWIFNAIPAWTTSTFVVVLLLFCTSDSSLWFFREGFEQKMKDGVNILMKIIIYVWLLVAFRLGNLPPI